MISESRLAFGDDNVNDHWMANDLLGYSLTYSSTVFIIKETAVTGLK
jgi:hypothetical protein